MPFNLILRNNGLNLNGSFICLIKIQKIQESYCFHFFSKAFLDGRVSLVCSLPIKFNVLSIPNSLVDVKFDYFLLVIQLLRRIITHLNMDQMDQRHAFRLFEPLPRFIIQFLPELLLVHACEKQNNSLKLNPILVLWASWYI